jgi:formylglycine-generating enzyme required for sulfatase activity
LAKFPVTNEDYRVFVEHSSAPEPPLWNEKPFSHRQKPVVGVNWFEAQSYCEWLSRCTGKLYHLPTEAEWERAARGGLAGKKYPWGDSSPDEMALVGWDAECGGPPRVGQSDVNDYGLCDMSGGVHEWCNDNYDYRYYARSPERNPQGADTSARRSSRGGSWRHRIKFSRCAARSSLDPKLRYADYGFRVAMKLQN